MFVDAPSSPRQGRVLTWITSFVAAVLLLWLASFRIELWPNALVLANPQLLVLAVVLQVPYALCRAWRLAPLLDVRIRQHSHESIARIPRSLLYGSGLLGFFVGLVMRASGGRANPRVVAELVKRVAG